MEEASESWLPARESQRGGGGVAGGNGGQRSARSERRRPGGAGERSGFFQVCASVTELMEPVRVIGTGAEPEGGGEGGGQPGQQLLA